MLLPPRTGARFGHSVLSQTLQGLAGGKCVLLGAGFSPKPGGPAGRVSRWARASPPRAPPARRDQGSRGGAAGEGAGRVQRPPGPSEALFTLPCVSGLSGRSGGETEFTHKLTDSAGCAGGGVWPGPGRGREASLSGGSVTGVMDGPGA